MATRHTGVGALVLNNLLTMNGTCPSEKWTHLHEARADLISKLVSKQSSVRLVYRDRCPRASRDPDTSSAQLAQVSAASRPAPGQRPDGIECEIIRSNGLLFKKAEMDGKMIRVPLHPYGGYHFARKERALIPRTKRTTAQFKKRASWNIEKHNLEAALKTARKADRPHFAPSTSSGLNPASGMESSSPRPRRSGHDLPLHASTFNLTIDVRAPHPPRPCTPQATPWAGQGRAEQDPPYPR